MTKKTLIFAISLISAFSVTFLYSPLSLSQTSQSSQPSPTPPTSGAKDEVEQLRKQLKSEKEARKKAEQKSEALKNDLKDSKAEAKAAVSDAKKEADNKIKDSLNQFKYINVAFGVLPNEEKDINNYSQISLNYSPALQTSLTYYSRTTSLVTKESKTTDDPDGLFSLKSESERSAATKRMDVNFDLIRYAPAQFKMGGGLGIMSMAAGAYYTDSQTKTNYNVKNSYIDPSTKREKNVPASGAETESLKSFLPQIVGKFEYTAPWALVRLSAGGIVLSRDKKSFKNKGAILMPSDAPDPKTNSPYKESVYTEYQFDTGTSYTASGYKFGAELEYHSSRFGGFGFHFDYLEKFGDTKAFSVEPNVTKGTQDVAIAEVYEERATMQLAASHSMDYIGHLGVTPVIRFNSNTDRLIKTPKVGARVDTKAKSYDFGVIFKY